MSTTSSDDVLQSQNVSFVSQVPSILAATYNPRLSVADWNSSLSSAATASSSIMLGSYSASQGGSTSFSYASTSSPSTAPWEVDDLPRAPTVLAGAPVNNAGTLSTVSTLSSFSQSSTSLVGAKFGFYGSNIGIDPNMGKGVEELINVPPPGPVVATAVAVPPVGALRLGVNLDLATDPEPATWTFMVLGLAACAFFHRRRKQTASV